MRIVVCMKQTFDTEEKIAIADGRVEEVGAKFVINPYDEFALEEAVRLKEACGASVTVVTVGPERAESALRSALALGADEAVHVLWETDQPDERAVAVLLAAVIRERGAELVLTGQASVDNGAAQVGGRLAERLGMPHIAAVTKLEVYADGRVKADRDAEGDTEQVEAMLPLLVTAQQGLNEPRYPSLPGIMKAKKKPIMRLSPPEMGVSTEELEPATLVTERTLPKPKPPGERLSGTAEEQAAELAARLQRLLGL